MGGVARRPITWSCKSRAHLCCTMRDRMLSDFTEGGGDVKVGDGGAGGLDSADEHDVTVARLKHEKSARVQLLQQLDALRANKVRASLSAAASEIRHSNLTLVRFLSNVPSLFAGHTPCAIGLGTAFAKYPELISEWKFVK